VRAQGDDMIGCDDALIVQAQAAGQIEAAGQGAEVASRVGGGVGEALVVVPAKASEHDIGLRQSGGLGEAELADQTVLESAPGALDAALGLVRVSGDLLDAELF
jgi:microcystin degradation protein MlrC